MNCAIEAISGSSFTDNHKRDKMEKDSFDEEESIGRRIFLIYTKDSKEDQAWQSIFPEVFEDF